MGFVTEESVMGIIRVARPAFRNAHDKVAFAVHATFAASGYLLHATGPPSFSDDALSSTSTEEVGIEHWNDFDDNYGFVYSHPGKGSKKVLVKSLAMNDKLLVDALQDGDPEPVHLEINVREYVTDDGGNNYTTMFKNIGKLARDVNNEILSKLGKSSKASSSDQKPRSESRVARGDDSISDQPRPRISEPEEPSVFYPPNPGYVVPPIPGSRGDDLFPGAPAGVYPRGNFGVPGFQLLGPDDPYWSSFGGSSHEPRIPGGQPGVPPGARFDPYGPPGVPGFEPNRFIRNPRRRGGGNHPDLEHFGDGSDFI